MDPFIAAIVDEVTDAVVGNLRRVSVVAVDDSGTFQRLSLNGLVGEQFKRVVRAQHFGLSSVPPAGAEGLILEQGGRADRAHVLGLEHKDYRPTGYQPGDTVLYDAHGNMISLVKQNINIVAAQTVTLKGATIILNGNVYLGGPDGTLIALCGGGCATKVYAT